MNDQWAKSFSHMLGSRLFVQNRYSMLYLMITGVVGIAQGYSQTEAQWFDDAAAAKAAFESAVDGWKDVRACDRFTSNNLTQCTFKVPFHNITMGVDVLPIEVKCNPSGDAFWIVWDQTKRQLRTSVVPTMSLLSALSHWCTKPCRNRHDRAWASEELTDAVDHVLIGEPCFVNALNGPIHVWPIPNLRAPNVNK